MANLKVAVFGCGHFGRYHAQKYAAHPQADLLAVIDSNIEKGEALAREVGTRALTDATSVLDQIDAASVVVPTSSHFKVASLLLDRGISLLVEKPLAADLEQARALVALAADKDAILHVGHLERFNPAVRHLNDVIEEPLFIESHRLTAFQERGTDVNVVLDLMIHDIDLIQMFLGGSPLRSIDAVGVPVLSTQDDIANARLRFECDCVVNVTASRASIKPERKMRLFQRSSYVSIDFEKHEAIIARRGQGMPIPGLKGIGMERRQFERADTLALEIDGFLRAVKGDPAAGGATGRDGLRAVETAIQITNGLQRPQT
ncbi:MAG: Gfo/Idh/MocA family protein [Geminicoccaceae bacterium]